MENWAMMVLQVTIRLQPGITWQGTTWAGISMVCLTVVLRLPSIPNPNLTWYKIKSYNAGIDFGFLNNKLTGTFEIYRRDRAGLLATSAEVIPGTVGAALPQENLNNDRNFGYELSHCLS